MALGERFRSGGPRAIARFLGDHQDCDAGFDVRREDQAGSGKLTITCLGCGQTVSYRGADAGDITAAAIDAPGINGGGILSPLEPPSPPPAAPVPPRPVAPAGPRRVGPPGGAGTARPAPPTPTSPPPARPAPPRRARAGIPGWIPIALIALLIAGGLIMIVAGLTTEDDDAGGGTTAPQPTAPAETDAPAPAPAPPAQEPPAAEPDAPAADQPPLRRRGFAGRFTIGLPAGWRSSGNASDGFVFGPRGRSGGVSVFFEQGARPLGELAGLAAAFLTDRHGDAAIAAAEPIRLAGGRAAEVLATYAGGEEAALVLARGGFSYLVLRRVDAGAAAEVERQAVAVAASLRPR